MRTTFYKVYSLLDHDERKSVIILFGFMIVGMILEMLGVGLVVPVISVFSGQDLAATSPQLKKLLAIFGEPSQESIMIIAMLSMVAVYLIKNIFLSFLAWFQMRFVFVLRANLSQRLFSLYLHQPYTFHLQRNSAQLVRNVNGEVGIFTTNAVMPAVQLFTEGTVLLGICALLVFVEPIGTIIVAVIFGIASFGFHRFTKKHLTQWGKSRQYHEGKRIQHLIQGLNGVKDVKLLGRENEFLQQHDRHVVNSSKVNQYQATLQQLPRLWLEFLGVAGLASIVIGMLLLNKEINSILPTIALFAAAAFRLMPSANRMIAAIQRIRFGLPAVDTLFNELNLDKNNNNINRTMPQRNIFDREISIDKISYIYPGRADYSIKDVSLNIAKGEMIGFIGSSGSGKSTLVDIILGLLTPSLGKVMVDGIDIKQNLRNWQNQIGYVPQSIYLTDDTLRHNIAFGIPDDEVDELELMRCIKASKLEEFISGLENGLNTMVGERGVRLSGGQLQRIGIARALYHDPSILVLDEATSALDSETENEVMDSIIGLYRKKTIIIVAHRLTTLSQCDRIYQLEKGSVVAEKVPADIGAIKNI